MHGGSLFLTGAQSCVFDIPAPCKGRPYTLKNSRNVRNISRKVYKVIDPEAGGDFEAEIETSSVLSKIPDYQDYFVLVDDVCSIEEKPEGWETCHLYGGRPTSGSFLQLKMEYGGALLTEYIRLRESLYKNWLRIQINIAEALKQLHVRNWVHGDLHSRNIVVDYMDRARIIDFGQSFNVNRIKQENINLNFLPEYDVYGPEMDYLAGVSSGADSTTVINLIYTKKKVLDKINDIFPSERGVLGALQGFAQFHVMPFDINKYMKFYSKPADIWSFAYDFLTIYLDMITDPRMATSEFYRRNHRAQMLLFKGMLNVDPRLRYDIDQVLKELYSMRLLWN